jgi:hypothetical protein
MLPVDPQAVLTIDSDKVHFDFTSTSTAAVAVNSKYSYLTHPNIIDQLRFAGTNELYVKGMREEEFLASLGLP